MQKRAQFDDRIRNLIALAQDGSTQSRSLLFSHISDLFLQKRPMASAVQVRMLTEILKELLAKVALSTRQEIASALIGLNDPPEELIDIMCEDVVEVSGPLLEKAILPDEKLIHVIRYGTEAHRIHISRRFGLSPLVRHELEKAQQESQNSKLKYSLNELEKLAENHVPDLDEETTANILELLRAQHIHNSYPSNNQGREAKHSSPAQQDTNKSAEILSCVIPTSFPRRPESNPTADPSFSGMPEPESRDEISGSPQGTKDSAVENTPAQPEARPEVRIESLLKKAVVDHLRPRDIPSKDSSGAFPTDIAANDAALPDNTFDQSSTLQMEDTSAALVDDIWQQVEDIRSETNKQREFVRSVADWFWEVDRGGVISYLSEEAFTAFGRPAPTLIGEYFAALCTAPHLTVPGSGGDTDQPGATFESLFEHRSSFRDKPFYITSQDGQKTLWYINAIAIFDIHTGRFTGFRGSARLDTGGEQRPETTMPENPAVQEVPPSPLEKALEENISAQVLKAVTKDAKALDTGNEEVAADLLQNLSHEFRTPLNAIIGFTEMIDMETWGPVNQQYHQNTKNILTAAGQLKEAVNDVLDSAKLEAGLMQIQPESFTLKSVLKACRENVAALARENNVQLLDSDNNIDVILYNDKQSVELCLTKMLVSSIKRATGGEIISPSVLINSNAQVRIEIPILGPKIDEKDAEKMFHRLKTEPDEHRKSPRSDMKYEPKISTGFGLSIAQSLAHMIGGGISVHSAQGKVTHLVLTLSNHDLSS